MQPAHITLGCTSHPDQVDAVNFPIYGQVDAVNLKCKPMLRCVFSSLGLLVFAASASAGELVVNVSGIRGADGEVGCALHSDAAQFPTGNSGTRTQWTKADTRGVTCRFAGLPSGGYAVAVSHDLNGNRKTDTNLLGMPKEDWGVSNNVRPGLRAPTFKEAKIVVSDSGTSSINVKLGR